MPNQLNIWSNAKYPEHAMNLLKSGVGDAKLVISGPATVSNLVAGAADAALAEADIAFGQPDPQQIIALPRLKWVHLTSAGYTRYDRDDLRAAFRARGATLTTSSAVYAEPCAEHMHSMMMAIARELPDALAEQAGSRKWSISTFRGNSRLLVGQTALILSFGAIAQRLVELLAPFRMNLIAVRRQPTGKEPIRVEPDSKVDDLIPLADHVINILPAAPSTEGFMTAARFAKMKPDAVFYNIGRGTTVDQNALIETLQSKRIRAAFLDVTDPEPLPKDHPLWSVPNCYITPHTGGGHSNEFERLMLHFLENLKRFKDNQPLVDKVI